MRFPQPKPAVVLVLRALGNALSSEKGLVSDQAVEGLCALTPSAVTQKEPPVQVPATDSWDSPNIDSRFFPAVSSTYTMLIVADALNAERERERERGALSTDAQTDARPA